MNEKQAARKMPLPYQLARWVPALSIVACSSWLSSLNRIESMPAFAYADKIVHTICFAGLAFWVAFANTGWQSKKSAIWWLSVAMVSVYGLIDEIHQSFVPGRSAGADDWVADTLGAMMGAAAYLLWIKMWNQQTNAVGK